MGDTERIGRYQLWEEIGRGDCAIVRRATVPGAPPIAAKLFRPELARSPRVRELLTRIGGALSRVPHDGLVRMHDLVAEPDRLALIVDFVDGPSLRAYLAGESGTLPLEDSAVVAAQVADVLATVHAHGLVHLDLKPENVLLVGGAYPLRVKVGDFGMAALPAGPGVPVGAYAAPELATGGPPTAAADVYALGVLLAEMTSGTRPTPGRSGLLSVPHPVRDLVRDCLATRPWERPAASDVAMRIRAVVAAATPRGPTWPAPSPEPAPVPSAGRLFGAALLGGHPYRPVRRRAAWAAGAAGALVAAVSIGLTARAGEGVPAPSPVAGPSAATGFGARPTGEHAGPGEVSPVERQKLANAAPARATYAARLPDGVGTLSLAVRDGRVVAYLCDGDRVEAWLTGPVQGDRMSLTGRDGAALTGSLGKDRVTGRVTVHHRPNDFSLPRVTAPAGLYRVAARLGGAEVRGGWIVLPDGSQVGVLTTDGAPGPAPSLDTGARSATVGADTVLAIPVDVTTGTGF